MRDGGVDGGSRAGLGLRSGGEMVAHRRCCCCCCRGGRGGFHGWERNKGRTGGGRRRDDGDVVRIIKAGAPVAEIRRHDEHGGRVRQVGR